MSQVCQTLFMGVRPGVFVPNTRIGSAILEEALRARQDTILFTQSQRDILNQHATSVYKGQLGVLLYMELRGQSLVGFHLPVMDLKSCPLVSASSPLPKLKHIQLLFACLRASFPYTGETTAQYGELHPMLACNSW